MQGDVPVSPLDSYRAEVRALEDAYRPVNHDGPHEMAAFQAYMDGTRAAFRKLFDADPDTADRMFADSMMTVSRAGR